MPIFTNEQTAVDLDIRDLNSATDSVAAIGPLTDTELRATPVPVATDGLTDAELRATPVPVSIPTPVPVTDNAGSLTVDGTVSISGSVAVTGPLTDTELRATPVPISGSVSTTPSVSTTSTITVVAAPNNTNTTLLSANVNRRAAILQIEKANTYVKFGATASSSSYTYKTPAANTIIETEVWTGRIDSNGPAGAIAVTELAL